MRLGELLAGLGVESLAGPADPEIRGVTCDSRRVEPGFVFVCVRGFTRDGHEFIGDALARGARVLVVDREVDAAATVTVVRVKNSREALPRLAGNFYGHPSDSLRVIGVTGTNGKTTTTHLIEAIMRGAGHRTGLIGTIRNKVGDRFVPVERTTPESVDLEKLLRDMADLGSRYVVMEVSSHALELHRVQEIEFDTAVFTNITRDHLDFHGTFENYFAAKAKLFEQLGTTRGAPLKANKLAVINADDPAGARLARACKVPVMTFSATQPADLRAVDIRVERTGASFVALTPRGRVPLKLKLTGMFNVYNALAALGAGVAEGIDLESMRESLQEVAGVTGRFELVDCGQDFAVIVDYAHTPDGLENIMRTVAEFASGRKILVFGCGGDRDRTKRPIMGEIAAKMADHAIVTSDNPRSEDPAAICREIEQGIRNVPGSSGRYEVIVDRYSAIRRAVDMAEPGDVVVIAGKGHETYQIFADRTIPFDDREVAARVLRGEAHG